jgi:hypothetical protein
LLEDFAEEAREHYEREKSGLVWIRIIDMNDNSRVRKYKFMKSSEEKEEVPKCFDYMKCYSEIDENDGKYFYDYFGKILFKLLYLNLVRLMSLYRCRRYNIVASKLFETQWVREKEKILCNRRKGIACYAAELCYQGREKTYV